MNGADWVIVAILGISVLVGLWRGLIREALSLIVWLSAIAAAIMFGGQVAAMYGDWISLPSARVAAGYVTVFLIVLIAGSLLAWVIGRLIQGAGMGGTDRMLGLGFGLLRGGLIVAALVLVLGYTPLPQDPWWRESQLIPRFEPAAVWLRERIPDTLASLKGLSPVQPVEATPAPVEPNPVALH